MLICSAAHALQLAQAKEKAEAAEFAAARAAASQEVSAHDASAARGRASAAEAALETTLATVKELCTKQALASNGQVQFQFVQACFDTAKSNKTKVHKQIW